LRTIIIIVLLMLPFSIYAVQQPVSYTLMNDLPDDSPAVEGYNKLKEGLGEGNILPLTVVVTERSPETLAKDIAQLSDELMKLDGVGDIRSLNNPLGVQHEEYRNFLRVDSQLRLVMAMSSAENIDLEQALAGLEDLKTYLEILQTRFPEIQEDANLNRLETLLANPLTLQAQRDEFNSAIDGLAARFSTIEDAYLVPDTLASSEMLSQLIDTYLSLNKHAYKMEIILGQAPTNPKSMDTVKAIRQVLSRYEGSGDAVVSGAPAIDTDIRDTMNRDFVRAMGFVLLGIFLVLLLMLRSVVAPLYLIGTVLLSFTFTLGLSQFVFQKFFDISGLTWYVPFFAFVFLVALGIDYSIFLFGRVKEEVANRGIHEGVHIAVASTGAIITSAGIILAGTFA
ncbi:MAG: MMPL family transporter, partial [Anaerolineae bacterium]|nr:MMPL family transporter [Anaerolineae bacterium]